MTPQIFEGWNIIMNKPDSMTHKECGSLHAYRCKEGFTSFWKLDKNEKITDNKIYINFLSPFFPVCDIWIGSDKSLSMDPQIRFQLGGDGGSAYIILEDWMSAHIAAGDGIYIKIYGKSLMPIAVWA